MTPPTTPTQAERELLPCPFCGGEAYLANPEPNALWRVICTKDCGAGNYISNRTAAITAWNTRANPAAIPMLVEALRLADAVLRGANMDMNAVGRKVDAALAALDKETGQ